MQNFIESFHGDWILCNLGLSAITLSSVSFCQDKLTACQLQSNSTWQLLRSLAFYLKHAVWQMSRSLAFHSGNYHAL
jgi:hypothetical protein